MLKTRTKNRCSLTDLNSKCIIFDVCGAFENFFWVYVAFWYHDNYRYVWNWFDSQNSSKIDTKTLFSSTYANPAWTIELKPGLIKVRKLLAMKLYIGFSREINHDRSRVFFVCAYYLHPQTHVSYFYKMIYCVIACALSLGGHKWKKVPEVIQNFEFKKIDSKARRYNQYLSVKNDKNAFSGNKASFPWKMRRIIHKG